MLAKGRDTYKYFTKNHMLYERNQVKLPFVLLLFYCSYEINYPASQILSPLIVLILPLILSGDVDCSVLITKIGWFKFWIKMDGNLYCKLQVYDGERVCIHARMLVYTSGGSDRCMDINFLQRIPNNFHSWPWMCWFETSSAMLPS